MKHCRPTRWDEEAARLTCQSDSSALEQLIVFPVSVCRMHSLLKTVLLALVASVVLLMAVMHSWPTRVYSTVDLRQRSGLGVERLREERLPDPDPSAGAVPYRVKENVAGSVSGL